MGSRDWIDLARDAETGIETLRAHFEGHAYDPHWHDSYLIGYTEIGVQQPTAADADTTAPPARYSWSNRGDPRRSRADRRRLHLLDAVPAAGLAAARTAGDLRRCAQRPRPRLPRQPHRRPAPDPGHRPGLPRPCMAASCDCCGRPPWSWCWSGCACTSAGARRSHSIRACRWWRRKPATTCMRTSTRTSAWTSWPAPAAPTASA